MFSVQGPYPVIRAALWARGWVERRLPHPVQRAPHCHGDEEEDGDDVDVIAGEQKWIQCVRSRRIYVQNVAEMKYYTVFSCVQMQCSYRNLTRVYIYNLDTEKRTSI